MRLLRRPLFAAGYDESSEALFARMSVQPDDTRKGHIDTLIRELKAAGSWSKLHWLYVLAAHDSQAALLNWVASNSATNANATFTTDRGYVNTTASGNGLTGITPATSLIGNAHMGAYMQAYPSATATMVQACLSDWFRMQPNASGGIRYQAGSTNTFVSATINKYMCLNWTSTTTADFYLAKTKTSCANVSNNGSPATTLGMLVSTPTDMRAAVLHGGTKLTDAEENATYDAILKYVTAVGAN